MHRSDELVYVVPTYRSSARYGHDQTTVPCAKLQEQVLHRRKLVRELRTLQNLVKHRVVTGLQRVLHSNGNRVFG